MKNEEWRIESKQFPYQQYRQSSCYLKTISFENNILIKNLKT